MYARRLYTALVSVRDGAILVGFRRIDRYFNLSVLPYDAGTVVTGVTPDIYFGPGTESVEAFREAVMNALNERLSVAGWSVSSERSDPYREVYAAIRGEAMARIRIWYGKNMDRATSVTIEGDEAAAIRSLLNRTSDTCAPLDADARTAFDAIVTRLGDDFVVLNASAHPHQLIATIAHAGEMAKIRCHYKDGGILSRVECKEASLAACACSVLERLRDGN